MDSTLQQFGKRIRNSVVMHFPLTLSSAEHGMRETEGVPGSLRKRILRAYAQEESLLWFHKDNSARLRDCPGYVDWAYRTHWLSNPGIALLDLATV
jgi:hypothetical protein